MALEALPCTQSFSLSQNEICLAQTCLIICFSKARNELIFRYRVYDALRSREDVSFFPQEKEGNIFSTDVTFI